MRTFHTKHHIVSFHFFFFSSFHSIFVATMEDPNSIDPNLNRTYTAVDGDTDVNHTFSEAETRIVRWLLDEQLLERLSSFFFFPSC